MYLSIPAGATSKIIQVPIFDSSSTIGAMLAGLVYNSASLTAYYNREGAAGAATAITLVTATKGTWTSSGFVAVDGTNTPGWYELHVPDAALATGAKSVVIHLKGAANMVPVPIIVELTAVSNQDAVRGGMTALPSSGTLAVNPILNATQTGVTIPTVTTLTGHTAQTGDSYAIVNGASGLVAVKVDTAAILVDTGTTLDGRLPAALTANGNMKCSLMEILATALTETSGLLAAAFKKFFNVAAPTGTVNSIPDAVAGAAGGLPTTNGTKISQTVDLTAGQTIAANVTQVNGAAQTATLDTIKAETAAIVGQTGTTGVLLTAAYDSAKTALTTATTIADADTLTANSALLWLRRMRWMLNNKMAVVDATGAYTLYKDDGTASAATGTITDDSTTTTRSGPTWA